MPTQFVYIPQDVYEKLVDEAKKLGVSVSKLINMIVRVYYESKEKEEVPYSARGIPSRVHGD